MKERVKGKSRITVALLAVLMVAALAVVSGMTAFAAVISADTELPTGVEWLSAYGESNATLSARPADSDTEMNNMSDAQRTFDFGFRVPSYDNDGNIAEYMGGETIGSFSPGTYRGTGLAVADGTTKLKLKTIASGSGMARYRYAYPVKLDGLTVDYNFSELVSGDHLCVTFSSNYDVFRHTTSKAYGITLTYYVDGSNYIYLNFGRSDTSSLTGSGGDIALVTDTAAGEEESFSVHTVFEETETQLIVTVANGGSQGRAYRTVIDKANLYNNEQKTDLSDEKGNTWINLTAFNDGNGANDNNDVFTTFVMKIEDEYRKTYKTSTLDKLIAAMNAYSAELIESASISTIEDVNVWVEKRDALDAARGGELRIGDAYLYNPQAKAEQANAALKTAAGNIVDAYLTNEIASLKTTMTKADGNEYTQITQTSEYETLSAAYERVATAYAETYAGLTTSSFDGSYLESAKESLERLDIHLALYAMENANLSSAAEIIAARYAYNQAKPALSTRISALAFDDSVKGDLLSRLTAIDTAITNAENGADKGELASAAIETYEQKAEGAQTVSDIYDALVHRGLVPNFDGLDTAAALQSRIDTADGVLSELAWNLIRGRVETMETLAAAGVHSYAEKAALQKAATSVSDTDLLKGAEISLNGEHTARYEKAVKAATDGIAAWQNTLAEKGVNIKSLGGETDANNNDLSADVSFSKEGLTYKFTGDQTALMFNKGYDIYEGIDLTFSVKQWAYLMNDGKGYSSNNIWIYFTNSPTNNRGNYGSVSVMFWNMVSTSDVKVYYETDAEEDTQHMTTFAEDDGSYVTVTFKANADRRRYEISVNYFDKDGNAIDNCISYLAYTASGVYAPAVLFPTGKAYVGIAGYMTNQVGNLYNEWQVRSVGDSVFYEKTQDEPVDPDHPSEGDPQPEKPGKPAKPESGLAGWKIALIVIACVIVAGGGATAAVLLVRRKNKVDNKDRGRE